MASIGKACVALAVLAFIMAVITSFSGHLIVNAESYSRAANNLALLALCFFIGFKEGPANG